MTRADLIHALAYRSRHLTAEDAEDAVKEILGCIGAALGRGDRVVIRDFGSFSPNYRAPRAGRTPSTGGPIAVPAKYVPHFKAGKKMRERVEQTVKSETIRQAA